MLKTLTVGLFLAVALVGAIGAVPTTGEPAITHKANTLVVIDAQLVPYSFDEDVAANSNCGEYCVIVGPTPITDADAKLIGSWTAVISDKPQMWTF